MLMEINEHISLIQKTVMVYTIVVLYVLREKL